MTKKKVEGVSNDTLSIAKLLHVEKVSLAGQKYKTMSLSISQAAKTEVHDPKKCSDCRQVHVPIVSKVWFYQRPHVYTCT